MPHHLPLTFWRNKTVFITGHTGFKGTWLSLWLNKLGATVVGYSIDIPTKHSIYESVSAAQFVDSHVGDVLDKDALSKALAVSQPDIVMHLAAQSLVRKSYENPLETFEVNVMGTANLLEAVRYCDSVQSCVLVTSDKCYENREWDWGYRESEAMGGHDTYSASKGCAELVVSAYRRSFFNDAGRACSIATARAGNVIGGGDWAEERLVPSILESLVASEPVAIRSPNSVRPWQHTLEPLSGYLMLAQALFVEGDQYAQGWNFGPSDSDTKSVSWMANKFVELWSSGSWAHDASAKPHEAKHLKLDSSKARADLGWTPVWNTCKAIEMTIEWHKAWVAGDDVLATTNLQIESYMLDLETALENN